MEVHRESNCTFICFNGTDAMFLVNVEFKIKKSFSKLLRVRYFRRPELTQRARTNSADLAESANLADSADLSSLS